MIPVEEFQHNERWDVFENAATHSYARSILEKDKKKDVLTIDDNYSKRTITTAEYDNLPFCFRECILIFHVVLMGHSQLPMNNKQLKI